MNTIVLPRPTVSLSFLEKRILNQSIEEAKRRLKQLGYRLKIEIRDGQKVKETHPPSPTKRNVRVLVEDDHVVDVYGIF